MVNTLFIGFRVYIHICIHCSIVIYYSTKNKIVIDIFEICIHVLNDK